MPMTVANADLILKDFFGPAVESQIADGTVLLKSIKAKSDTETFGGRQWRQPIELGRNETVGPVAEDTSLPGEHANETVRQSRYGEWLITAQSMYASCGFTGQSLAVSKNSKESFVRVKTSEMQGLARAFSQGLNRYLNGDGFGALGRVSTGSTATVYSLRARTAEPEGGTRYFKVGQHIQVKTTKGSTADFVGSPAGTIARITAVDALDDATPTVTVAATIGATPADGDFVFVSRSRSDEGALSTPTNRVPMGIDGCVDDGTDGPATFQGVVRASNPEVNAVRLANSGTNRALSKTLMQLAIDLPQEAEGDDTIKLIHCHQSLRRAYVALLADDIRFMPEEAKGGFSNQKLSYNGGNRPIPIQTDRFALYGKMYFLDPSTFKVLQLRDMGWLDDGNGGIIRYRPGLDSYRAYYHWYFNLACFKPSNNSKVVDLTRSFS